MRPHDAPDGRPQRPPRHTSADDRDVHHRDRLRHGIRPCGRRPRPRRRRTGLGGDAVPGRRDRSDAARHVDAAGRRVGAAEPARLPARAEDRRARGGAQVGRRSARRGRRRHRLHRLHDAAGEGRRHAADGAARVPRQPARVGQAVEAPRGAAARRSRHRDRRRARRGVAAPLRRQDLERVVPGQGAADPRRGAGDLSRRRSADRGRRLGDLADVRRRDAQHLHRRLQGQLPGRRLPDVATTSARSTPASPISSRRSCRRRWRRSAAAPAI